MVASGERFRRRRRWAIANACPNASLQRTSLWESNNEPQICWEKRNKTRTHDDVIERDRNEDRERPK
jgi:hypothetical protein